MLRDIVINLPALQMAAQSGDHRKMLNIIEAGATDEEINAALKNLLTVSEINTKLINLPIIKTLILCGAKINAVYLRVMKDENKSEGIYSLNSNPSNSSSYMKDRYNFDCHTSLSRLVNLVKSDDLDYLRILMLWAIKNNKPQILLRISKTIKENSILKRIFPEIPALVTFACSVIHNQQDCEVVLKILKKIEPKTKQPFLSILVEKDKLNLERDSNKEAKSISEHIEKLCQAFKKRDYKTLYLLLEKADVNDLPDRPQQIHLGMTASSMHGLRMMMSFNKSISAISSRALNRFFLIADTVEVMLTCLDIKSLRELSCVSSAMKSALDESKLVNIHKNVITARAAVSTALEKGLHTPIVHIPYYRPICLFIAAFLITFGIINRSLRLHDLRDNFHAESCDQLLSTPPSCYQRNLTMSHDGICYPICKSYNDIGKVIFFFRI